MEKIIDAEWLKTISKENLTSVLLEFRHYFHRFTPSLALIFGNAQDEKVRQLLISNLIEECGSLNGQVSHLKLLDNLLASCGIENPENYQPSKLTKETEQWFFDLYKGENTLASLCALGPATESISSNFLFSMMDAVKETYKDKDKNIDLTYFHAHLSEMEDEHAESIMKAIEFVEEKNTLDKSFKNQYISLALDHHKLFWSNLKSSFSDN